MMREPDRELEDLECTQITEWLGEHRAGAAQVDDALASLAEGALPEIAYEVRAAIAAWLLLGKEAGYFTEAMRMKPDIQRLPTNHDLDHSSLLRRLLSQNERRPVLLNAPPTQMSYPWVSLIRDRGSREIVFIGENVRRDNVLVSGKNFLFFNQAVFEITDDNIDGWIHAEDGRWKIRAREGVVTEEDYQRFQPTNGNVTPFEVWKSDFPINVWEIEVVNPVEECRGFNGVEEIFLKFDFTFPKSGAVGAEVARGQGEE